MWCCTTLLPVLAISIVAVAPCRSNNDNDAMLTHFQDSGDNNNSNDDAEIEELVEEGNGMFTLFKEGSRR